MIRYRIYKLLFALALRLNWSWLRDVAWNLKLARLLDNHGPQSTWGAW